MTKIMIDEGYRPSDDEPFMNERQREYFRRKLIRWKGRSCARRRKLWPPSERERKPSRHRRPRFLGDRPRHRAARPRPAAQTDRQNRRGPRPDRGGHLRLLRGDRRPDLDPSPRGPTDRDPLARGAGAPRAQRARLPRRLIGPPAGGFYYGPAGRKSGEGIVRGWDVAPISPFATRHSPEGRGAGRRKGIRSAR